MEQRGMAPGFRFSPTDEELVVHYLLNYAYGKEYPQGIIGEVDLYKHEPWELPGKSAMPSRDAVWYFFNSQDKKHHHSARVNRTTSKGYWKATGKDRKVRCGTQTVGTKKTLIYYEGRAPSGNRTDWIMHEYKLDEELEKRSNAVCTAALCRVRKKGGPGPRNGEQFGAPTLYRDEGEDVEDNEIESFQNSTEGGEEVQSSFWSKDPKLVENMASLELPEVGCSMLNLSKDSVDDRKETVMVEMQGGRDGSDEDLYAFLESFFPDDSPTASLGPDDEGNIRVDGDYVDGLPDVESLLHGIEERENEKEEQILREIMHLIDGGQCEAIGSDGTVSLNDIGTVPESVGGDFIEINDMNSPLDGCVLRSPVPGGYYRLDHYDEQHQQPMTTSGLEFLGWSPNLLHAQGSAARRARLRIPIPTPHVPITHTDMARQIEDGSDTLRQVQIGIETNKIHTQIGRDACVNGDEIAESSSASVPDSSTSINSPKGPSTNVLCKLMSASCVVKCEEEPSQVFYVELSHTNREGSGVGDVLEGSCGKDKMGRRDLGPHELSRTGYASLDTTDCEAGESNGMMERGVLDILSSQDRDTWKSTISHLVNQTKSLSLGPRLVGDFDDKLRSGFDDKVCALGKPAAQLLPASPYSRLKTCVMTTLLRLAVAVLVIHLFILGFHALTH